MSNYERFLVMNVFEEMNVIENSRTVLEVTRVPGGYIYHHYTNIPGQPVQKTSTFVTFENVNKDAFRLE